MYHTIGDGGEREIISTCIIQLVMEVRERETISPCIIQLVMEVREREIISTCIIQLVMEEREREYHTIGERERQYLHVSYNW